MKIKLTIKYSLLFLALIPIVGFSGVFSKKLCKQEGYECYKVKRGDTWHKLYPDPQQRMMVMKINRSNIKLRSHRYVALPKNLFWKNLHDFSPLPYRIDTNGQPKVVISIGNHAFGAYDESGRLVRWGPISGGRGYCPDTNSYCRTVRGEFAVYRKGSGRCKSGKYPLATKGGAPMPYCMFFHRGYAMHGSTLPGHHASHGCVRMFNDDAKWLNQEFTVRGTKVEVVDRL